MKKLLIKYLILSIVFLSGYTHLAGMNTNIDLKNDYLFQTKNVSGVVYGKNDTYTAKSSLTHFEKFNCEIEITDGEDDETSSLKKNFKASPFFAQKNSISTSDFIIHHIQQASFYKKLSHLISCKRYILLQVIRI